METLDLHALFSRVTDDVNITGLLPHQAFACESLLKNLLKKVVQDSPTAKAQAALTFLEANHLSKGWKWPLGFQDPMTSVFNDVKKILDEFFHPSGDLLFSSYKEIFKRGRVGPGSALLSPGQGFYAKFGSAKVLTATSLEVCAMYASHCSEEPLWDECESIRSSTGEPNFAVVDSSKMTFVPKSVTTERAICVEPSINMFYQLGLEDILRDRLRTIWNVDLAVQPDCNRLLAKIGSRDGNFATLDLSSASDRISWRLAEELLPSYVFDVLGRLRSQRTYLPDFGLDVELGMMSTMGNGFTFPMMTIILSAVVRAVYRHLGVVIHDNARVPLGCPLTPGNWAVFGDDIICVREAYDMLVSFLQLLGLEVNLAKSFNEGPFRESCGHDYYLGHNVRAVYLKGLRTRQESTVAVNLLNEWSARTGISLVSAVSYLLGALKGVPLVPYADNMDAGIRVPASIWSGKYVAQKCIYKRYEQRTKSYQFGDGVVIPPRGGRRWRVNSAAALMALLRGELRNGKISVRHNEDLYHTRWSVTPYWDYVPPSIWVNPRLDWQRWKTAVEQNMLNLGS